MAVYSKDEKGSMVPAPELPAEALIAIDRAEDEQIIKRITDINVQPYYAYAYQIMTKHGPVDIVGISVDGAREIARLLGNIKVGTDIKVEDRGDYYYAVVPVTDLTRNITLLGVARQSKYRVGEGFSQDEQRVDEWAFVAAINKAQRNGILAVAPQDVVQQIVQKLDPKRIKRIPQPQHTPQITARSEQQKTVVEEVAQEKEESEHNEVTDDDKKALMKYLRDLGFTNQEMKPFIAQVTGKVSGWTKDDFEKVKNEAVKVKGEKLL